MKRFLRRAAALVLTATFLTTSVFASYALGDELHQYSIRLADGATLTTQMFYSNSKSDLRTENYITYTPSSSLSPLVSYGNTILTKQTVPSMASDLEKGGERVLSGINGDYFVMATGNPLGIVLTDGILRSSASYLSAIGFYADGSAIIGKPDLTVTAKFAGYALKVADINKVRNSTGGYYLLTQDFGATTQNSQPGVDVILSPVQDNLGASVTADNGQTVVQSNTLKIGSRVTCVVEQVLQSTGSISIPEGKFVMTINKNGGEFLVNTLSNLTPGSTMELEVTSSDPHWNNVDCAIGALYRILTDGSVNTGLDDTAAPRTAVGVKADGTVIFYTIDGRQSGLSIGATMTQVAKRLLELGCVNAVCLDGGGSTTLGTTKPDSNGFSVVNSPSDGSLRAVTNALFLVSNLSPSGVPSKLYVEPKNRVLLSGSKTTCTASFVDSNWFPLSTSDSITWSAKNGTITQDGTYTAPSAGVVDEITATSASGLTGSTTVTVYQSPTTINLFNETSGASVNSFNLSPNETINLKAKAFYRLLPLTAEDSNFTWSITPSSLGTITPEGVFTSGTVDGTGNIKVSAGTFVATIPVTVSVNAHYNLLEDFEGSSLSSLLSTNTCSLSQNTSADMVRYGQKSLRVDYTLNSGTAQIDASLNVDSQDTYLSIWVYGDSSGNELSLISQDIQGSTQTTPIGTLNYKGWKQFIVTLPDNAALVTAFTLSGSTNTGSIWLDQIVTSNQPKFDEVAPQVSLSVSGNQLSAKISDNVGTFSSRTQVNATLDGKTIDFSFTPASGTLTATLPKLSTSLHRITVTATDTCGNIGRASQTINSNTTNSSPFVDMPDHWATNYTDYLFKLNAVSGVSTNLGQYFYPDRSITRGDFALMTTRWMGLSLDTYASTSLPFSDVSSIPSWSMNAVKAMYSLGLMKGSQTVSGLYANATSSITRAEAMTILGRIQTKGYPVTSLSSFRDANAVPNWASSYLSSLVGQGVVGGYNGLLRPSDSVSRAEVAKMLVAIW